MLQKTPASKDSKCGRRVTARESSNLSISATSEQSPLCSDVFLCQRQKKTSSARSLPLPLLSNCDPLRWAHSWRAALWGAIREKGPR